MNILARKLKSARFRLGQAVSQWQENSRSSRKRHEFNAWLADLKASPPDVLVGSNFASFGGVRGHIHAIQKYSALNVGLAPSDGLMARLEPHDFKTSFRDAFVKFDAPGTSAVHSHVFPWFIEWCGRRQRGGKLWLHTYHLPYFAEHATGDLLPWQAEINDALIKDARHADVKISVSKWQRDWLKQSHDIESVYVPNGVDIEVCERGDAARFEKRTGLRDFILYVGRNDPVKNPADFVRLAQRMRHQQFVMIGKDLSRDALRSEWEVNVPDNLLMLGDASHGQVQDALAACATLVVTSLREGLPTVVLEAMAHSRVVVVPDEPGCVEAIGAGDCGLIYDPRDVDDLVVKTTAALGDSALGIRGRARVLREYDWRVVGPQLDALYLSGGAINGAIS